MKKKNKKTFPKKKKEFRFHKTEENIAAKKPFSKSHPAYVFIEKGNIYVYVTITHSNSVKDKFVIKLKKNPNPKDKREAYVVLEIKEDTKDRFGSRHKGWKMDEEDDEIIRKEFKNKKR